MRGRSDMGRRSNVGGGCNVRARGRGRRAGLIVLIIAVFVVIVIARSGRGRGRRRRGSGLVVLAVRIITVVASGAQDLSRRRGGDRRRNSGRRKIGRVAVRVTVLLERLRSKQGMAATVEVGRVVLVLAVNSHVPGVIGHIWL